MPLGNNVFHVVVEVTVVLMEQTVLVTVAGPLANQIPRCGDCHGWMFEVSLR